MAIAKVEGALRSPETPQPCSDALQKRDHRITLAEAIALTTRWREQLSAPIREADFGGAFDAAQVIRLLGQVGCTALRIYHGRNEEQRRTLILAGVNQEGHDMTSGVLLDVCYPCPPYCSYGELIGFSPLIGSRVVRQPLPVHDHTISPALAAEQTARHRASVEGPWQEADLGGAFDAEQVLQLVNQAGCVALRIYHGLSEMGLRVMVLAGVNSEGNDMTDGILMEVGWPCPPYCGSVSELARD